MTANDSPGSGGIGFVGLLTVALIVLRLCHVIDWSWWWVWSPVLACVVLFVFFVFTGPLVFVGLTHVVGFVWQTRRRIARSWRRRRGTPRS